MAQFIGLAPAIQVSGEAVLAAVNGVGTSKEKALEILAKNNIHNPHWDMWYLQKNFLDAFKEISETLGPDTLHAIGLTIPRSAKFPPGIDSIGGAGNRAAHSASFIVT